MSEFYTVQWSEWEAGDSDTGAFTLGFEQTFDKYDDARHFAELLCDDETIDFVSCVELHSPESNQPERYTTWCWK